MIMQEFVSAIEAGLASGQGASFSDIEFSSDERLRIGLRFALVRWTSAVSLETRP